ncbi:MAG: hypothetical protein HY659_13525 [Rhizobiales bacterium]|nr:hypothetical protein [Hyphomicrobiales bacterium]
MAAITYGTALVGKAATAAKPAAKTKAQKGFWARFYDRLVEAQMKRARREIRMHAHLLPTGYEFADPKISYKNERQLPFVR